MYVGMRKDILLSKYAAMNCTLIQLSLAIEHQKRGDI